MSSRKNKIKHEFGVLAGSFLGKPSPHVLDLRKIVDERTDENAVLTETEDSFEGLSKLSELTILNLLFDFGKIFKKFFKFLIHLISAILKFFIIRVRKTGDFFFRLFQFFRFSFADYKKIFSFGLIAFIFILPLQAFSYYESLKKIEKKALGEARSAYADILAGSSALVAASNFEEAALNFSQAAGAFGGAQNELDKINFIISDILKAVPFKGGQLEAGEAIFFAGEKLSWAGETILNSLSDLTSGKDEKKLTQKIKILRNHLVVALPEIAAASGRLAQVEKKSLPEDKQEVFEKLKDELPDAVQSLKSLISVSDLIIEFLGDEAPKRYLLVFQNSGELRPTGGFMGSIALVDFDRGQIKNLEIPGGGPYDFRGSLREKVAAPEPLSFINPRWQLQDANWFPEFPASAEKIKWFYEKSGGPTIDGVIAVNSGLMVNLLDVVGPISMPEYGKVIDKENFIQEIQKAVEIEYDKKENKPKKIIADLAPELIKKIMASEPKQFGKILAVFAKALREKDVLLYSVFPETEHQIANFDWGGKIKAVDGELDSLMVVHTNIGGSKTDSVIDEKIRLEIKISDDGYIKNKVIIKKAHRGIKGDPFTGGRNIDYLRIYAPSGSILLGAEGFEIPPENLFVQPEIGYRTDQDLKNIEGKVLVDEASGTRITNEFGKTVFGNWMQVEPGEEASASFEYMLPFKFFFNGAGKTWWEELKEKFGFGRKEKIFYRLLVQKQSGTNADFEGKLDFPAGWQTVWQYGEGIETKNNSIETSGRLNSDKFFSAGFEAVN